MYVIYPEPILKSGEFNDNNVLADPEACRKRFVDGFRSRRRKFNALEVHRILYAILDIASVDGAVEDSEMGRLRELAELIGVPENACDLVVRQYVKENTREV